MQLPLLPAVSHARTPARPEAAQALTATARAYGRNCAELLATFDPSTRLWKTCQGCLLAIGADGMAEYSETWPRSGMAASGTAYRLPVLVPITNGTGYGLLPTPAASDYGTSQNGVNGISGENERPSANTPSLPHMARHGLLPKLIPTPTAGDAKASGSRNTESSRANPGLSLTDWLRGDGGTGRGQGSPSDCAESCSAGEPGPLAPEFVEWLMGFPIGWTDLEASVTP